MNHFLENPELPMILIVITIAVVFVSLFALSKFLENWFGKLNPTKKDPLPPRKPETFEAKLKFDSLKKRWTLADPGGKPKPALVVRGGDTIKYSFLAGEKGTIHFQYPNNDLFVNYPGSIDPWVTTIGTGDTLEVEVAPFVNLDSPLVYYAIFIESDVHPSGYVKGASPPKIIVEHA